MQPHCRRMRCSRRRLCHRPTRRWRTTNIPLRFMFESHLSRWADYPARRLRCDRRCGMALFLHRSYCARNSSTGKKTRLQLCILCHIKSCPSALHNLAGSSCFSFRFRPPNNGLDRTGHKVSGPVSPRVRHKRRVVLCAPVSETVNHALDDAKCCHLAASVTRCPPRGFDFLRHPIRHRCRTRRWMVCPIRFAHVSTLTFHVRPISA